MPKRSVIGGVPLFSGLVLNPFFPNPEMMNITDIAHALSQNNRFNGHARVPVSVAQHCIHVLQYVTYHKGSKTQQRQALMHDATEAYIPDLSSPVKHQMPEFMALEDSLWEVISRRFSVPEKMSQIVEDGDQQAFYFEYHERMNLAPAGCAQFLVPDPTMPFSATKIATRSASYWKNEFIQAAARLEIM